MNYEIKRGNAIVATVRPTGTVTRRIMAEEQAELQFALKEKKTFLKHDYIVFKGTQYTLLDSYSVQQNSSREWVYTMTFLSIKYRLREASVLFYDQDNQLTVPSSSLMATAEDMVAHVVTNANRLQSGWSVGTVEATVAKNLQFDEMNCLAALAKIAEAFKLEYWVDGDKSIHFTERKPDANITLRYGKGQGLTNLTRTPLEGSAVVTRLYVKGAERNLPRNYRNGQKSLRMDVPYLEKNTAEYGIIEHTETFEEIYPKRTGEVTAVDPGNPLVFTDDTLDFDLNAVDNLGNTTVLIPNLSAKVIFQTGQLGGYTFEIQKYHSASKTFTIIENKDETAWDVPSETVRPAVGDQYIIIDIQMPQSYVTNAEAELKAAGQDYLDANSVERFSYIGESDPFTFAALNFQPQIGELIKLQSTEFALDDKLRVTGTIEDLNNLFDVQLEFSEVAFLSPVVTEYYEQERKQQQEVRRRRYDAAMARRAYLFARENAEKVFDADGYFDIDNIKPGSIDTKLISLGAKSQQFTLEDVLFTLMNDYTELHFTAGKLIHQTIEDDGLRTWQISAGYVELSDDYNYVYAKAQKNGENATVIATEDQITVDEDPDYYHFQIGYVSSIQDDMRIFRTNYGFGFISPAEISIGRWSAPVGDDFIEFGQDGITICGRVMVGGCRPVEDYIREEVHGKNLFSLLNIMDLHFEDGELQPCQVPGSFDESFDQSFN